MAGNLVAKLQRALLQHQVPLRESDEERNEDPTLAYISNFLLNDDDNDEDDVANNRAEKSQAYLDELNSLIQSSSAGPDPHSSRYVGDLEIEGLSKKDRLENLVMEAARAVVANNAAEVYRLVDELSRFASPKGDCWERTAFHFVEALVARLGGYGPQLFKAVSESITSKELLSMRLLNLPVFRVMDFYANETILERCRGAKSVHIVDYGILHGLQWPSLMKALSESGETTELKITGIDFPNRVNVFATGRKLSSYAKMYGIHLRYDAVSTYDWELVQPKCSPNEVLIVNCNLRLRHLKEDGTSARNRRKIFFEAIHKLRPQMFLTCVASSRLSSPMFFPRFKEAVRYYTAKMEYFDALICNELEAKELSEKIICKNIISVVACEGHDRVEQLDSYDNWESRIRKGGFVPMELSEEICEKVTMVWGGYKHNENVGIGRDENWILLGWKDVVLYAMSAWETMPCEFHQ